MARSRRSLAGKRALITGASGGIGAGIALALAQRGADVAIVARRAEKLAQLAKRIESLGRRAIVCEGDVTNSGDRASALSLTNDQLGGLDILVNNAGVSAHGRFLDASPSRLREIMEVNFFAPAEFIREAAPMLQAGVEPIVVNVGSILGYRGLPHNSEYCASKFALRGLSEAIRPELARVGIDVLLVSPGTTETEFFDHLIDKQGEMPWKTRRGVSIEYVADATMKAIERNQQEIIPSPDGKWLVRASRWAPSFVSKSLLKYG